MKFNVNFLGRRKIWYIISLLIIIPGIISLFTQGLNAGIDFTGGTLIQVDFTETVTAGELRTFVDSNVQQNASIQASGEENKEYIIRTESLSEEASASLINAITQEFGANTILRNETIGPVIGAELLNNAKWSLILAFLLIMAYISIRFKFFYAISAIIPLLHDSIIVLSIFSLLQIEVNSSFIAAILTIIGYSINSTIVVFDRIRENTSKGGRGVSLDVINTSINQTLVRNINTNLAIVFLLLALIILGGATTRFFVLAMLMGVIAGAYSSVFIAGSLLYDITDHFDKNKTLTSGKNYKSNVSKATSKKNTKTAK